MREYLLMAMRLDAYLDDQAIPQPRSFSRWRSCQCPRCSGPGERVDRATSR